MGLDSSLHCSDAEFKELPRFNSGTSDLLSVKVRLGQRIVSLQARLNTIPRAGEVAKIAHFIFFALLTQTNPVCRKNYQKENPAAFEDRLDHLTDTAWQKLESPADEDPLQIKELRAYLQKERFQKPDFTPVESLSIQSRPLNLLEKLVLTVVKIWSRFIHWLFPSSIQKPQLADAVMHDKEEGQGPEAQNGPAQDDKAESLGSSSDSDDDWNLDGLDETEEAEALGALHPDLALSEDEAPLTLALFEPSSAPDHSLAMVHPEFKELYQTLLEIAGNLEKAAFEEKLSLPLDELVAKTPVFVQIFEMLGSAYQNHETQIEVFKPHLTSFLRVSLETLFFIPRKRTENFSLSDASQTLLKTIFSNERKSLLWEKSQKQLKHFLKQHLREEPLETESCDQALLLIQDPENQLTLNENNQVRKYLLIFLSWKTQKTLDGLSHSVKALAAAFRPETPLNNFLKHLFNPRPDGTLPFKEALKTAFSALNRNIAEKLLKHTVGILEKVDYTQLVDQTAAHAYSHTLGLQKAKAKLPPSAGVWDLGPTPEEFGQALEAEFPLPTLHPSLQSATLKQFLIETAEEFISGLLPHENLSEFCQKLVENLKQIAEEQILSIGNPDEKAQVQTALAQVQTALMEIIPSSELLAALPANLPLAMMPGIKKIISGLLVPVIKNFIQETLIGDLLKTISNPEYLRHLLEQNLLPALNQLFAKTMLSELFLSADYLPQLAEALKPSAADPDDDTKSANDDLGLNRLFEQDLAQRSENGLSRPLEELADQIAEDFYQSIYQKAPFSPDSAPYIQEEIKKIIRITLIDLKKQVQTAQAQSPELPTEHLVQNFFKPEEIKGGCIQNDIYWNFFSAFIFNLGDLLDQTWTRSLIENEFVKSRISQAFCNLFNPLRCSSHLLISTLNRSLDLFRGEKGQAELKQNLFGASPDLESSEAKRKRTAKINQETEFTAHLLYCLLYQNLGAWQRLALPYPQDLHQALKKALKTFLSSEKINQSLFLHLLDEAKKALKKAAALESRKES
ncbi:MAG: hypothetical protein WC371_01910 [Parachlamydiales bacterium]|jgi:hypothetical protein